MSAEKIRNIDSNLSKIHAEEIDGKYLTFWTDNQLFGVPISDVVQIMGVPKITQIPGFQNHEKGIINIRDEIITVIDVRLRFGRDEIPYNEKTCIIVTSIDETPIGFIVDGVEEVTVINDNEISKAPRISNEYTNEYITGVGKKGEKIILIVNIKKMLGD